MSCFELPPTLIQHMRSHERPSTYYWFWGCGLLCILITFFLLFPRIRQFRKHAAEIRDERDLALLPFPYVASLLFVSFPLIASIFKYLIFFAPIAGFTIDFVIKTYEALVLFVFTRVLIMYLGSYRNALLALKESAPKTKFYAVAPFGCCFRSCCKASTVTNKDFRNFMLMILQYGIVAPTFTFVLMLRTYTGQSRMLMVVKLIQILSAMICFYALLGLLKASHSLLEQFNIHGKFFCIKGLILAMVLPPAIMTAFHHLPEQNEVYNSEVMGEAWASMISIVCLTALSAVFLKFFKPEDALKCMHNADNKDHTASGLLKQHSNGSNGATAVVEAETELGVLTDTA